MGDLIRSGHLVEAILALTAVEWLALSAYHRLTGRGVPPRDFNRNLLSGMLLLLALREALVNGWWGWIAASLTGALVAHVADLGHRWIR
ncbi:hypothetical protein [Lichenifustis flavocetrariae]|uniref:Uncharacterized protein n=1 Tax=Lichenifustis flavocetrariae TaxID=2949735 RepID=A0AA41YUS7_9HYPH|nr:hypothetical protein [Lichenifustis flavocetrariae]MCW6507273.1 hypothetical protein [Lichenifustis flavocetrariae]